MATDLPLLERINCLLEAKQADGTAVKPVVDTMYAILNAIDGKANGLLRINSLFLSVIAAAATIRKTYGTPAPLPTALEIFVVLCFVALVASSVLCLAIMHIKWPFLGRIRKSADGRVDLADELTSLSHVATERTRYYGWSWWLTISGLSAFLLAVATAFVP